MSYSFNKKDVQDKFLLSIDNFKKSISGVSAKASAGLLDAIRFESYGSMAPITNAANVNVSDSRTLMVQVWDANLVQNVFKALQLANIGNAILEGQSIRLSLPPVTEESRKDKIKLIEKNLENCKVAMRNVRRDVIDVMKKAEKNKEISSDELKRYETEVQKILDEMIKKADEIAGVKIKEMQTV